MICKALTSRLQLQIGGLVDADQTGFLAGRSISENFVYATELVQTCFRRKVPCLVLKLDFAKAFDSIEWASLRRILVALGFPTMWCDWMDQILTTSRSAILLNGVLGGGLTSGGGSGREIPSPPTSSSSWRMCCNG
jgi:hypothetical protein